MYNYLEDIYLQAISNTEEIGLSKTKFFKAVAASNVANESSTFYYLANESVIDSLKEIASKVLKFIADLISALFEHIKNIFNKIISIFTGKDVLTFELKKVKVKRFSGPYFVRIVQWIQDSEINAMDPAIYKKTFNDIINITKDFVRDRFDVESYKSKVNAALNNTSDNPENYAKNIRERMIKSINSIDVNDIKQVTYGDKEHIDYIESYRDKDIKVANSCAKKLKEASSLIDDTFDKLRNLFKTVIANIQSSGDSDTNEEKIRRLNSLKEGSQYVIKLIAATSSVIYLTFQAAAECRLRVYQGTSKDQLINDMNQSKTDIIKVFNENYEKISKRFKEYNAY